MHEPAGPDNVEKEEKNVRVASQRLEQRRTGNRRCDYKSNVLTGMKYMVDETADLRTRKSPLEPRGLHGGQRLAVVHLIRRHETG